MEFIVLQPFRSIKISSGTDYKFWLLRNGILTKSVNVPVLFEAVKITILLGNHSYWRIQIFVTACFCLCRVHSKNRRYPLDVVKLSMKLYTYLKAFFRNVA